MNISIGTSSRDGKKAHVAETPSEVSMPNSPVHRPNKIYEFMKPKGSMVIGKEARLPKTKTTQA